MTTQRRLAKIHEIQILYKEPAHTDAPQKRRMFDIVAGAYVKKGGIRSGNCVLPDGSSNAKGLITCGNRDQGRDPDGVPWGGGRADVRLAMDGAGELYLMSKSDGMVRQMIAAGSEP